MKKRIQINGLIIFACLLLIIIFPAVFFRQQSGLIDNLVEIIALGCIFFGQLIRVSSRGYKAENSQSGNALIQTGPYALVRNPMYLGIFFIGIGVILFLFRWWSFFAFLSFFIIRYFLLIKKEEVILLQHFGEVYRQYQKKIPRLFPNLLFFLSLDMREYLPLRLGWIKKEISSISVLVFGCLTVEAWEETRGGSLVIFLPQLAGFLCVMIFFLVLVVYLARYYERKTS